MVGPRRLTGPSRLQGCHGSSRTGGVSLWTRLLGLRNGAGYEAEITHFNSVFHLLVCLVSERSARPWRKFLYSGYAFHIDEHPYLVRRPSLRAVGTARPDGSHGGEEKWSLESMHTRHVTMSCYFQPWEWWKPLSYGSGGSRTCGTSGSPIELHA